MSHHATFVILALGLAACVYLGFLHVHPVFLVVAILIELLGLRSWVRRFE